MNCCFLRSWLPIFGLLFAHQTLAVAPTIFGQNQVITVEDTPRTISLNDLLVSDPDSVYPDDFTLIVLDGLHYTHVGAVITPGQDHNDPLEVPVIVNDGVENSNTFILFVDIIPVNDPPTITGQNPISTQEDMGRTVTISELNVSDPDHIFPSGFSLFALDGDNYTRSNATATSFVITPNLNFNGVLNVPVYVNDGVADSDIFNLSITVTAVNDPPVISSQNSVSTPEETSLLITLSALNVSDPDNNYPDDFTLAVSAGSNYTLNGHIITPDPGFNGILSVPVTVNDGALTSPIFNLGVIVTGVNDPPVITGQLALSTAEETSLILSLNDLIVADADSQYPDDFSLTVFAGGNYSTSGAVITPNTNFNGDLSVPVRVNDGQSDSNVFNLTVTVTPVNDQPIITGQSSVATAEETPLLITFAHVLVSDPDNTWPDDFTLSVSAGLNYSLIGNVVTPNPNFNGVLTVPITVNDGFLSSPSFDLSLVVTPVNDPPQISGQNPVSTPQNTPRLISLSDLIVQDADNDPLTLFVTDGVNYTRSGNTITPITGFSGPLNVPVFINDGLVNSAIFNMTVQVIAGNDPPVITAQFPVDTPEETPLTIILDHLVVSDGNHVYPDDFTLTVRDGSNYVRSNVTPVSVDITPAQNFNGNLTIPVSVNDGLVESNVFNMTVTVQPVNDPPVITSQNTVSTLEETTRQLSLGDLIVSDPDNSYPSGFTLAAQDGPGYSRIGNSITPDLNITGTLLIPVTVSDGQDTSAIFELNMTVSPVNDPPVINGQLLGLTTGENTPLAIPMNALDVSDPDNTYPNDFTLSILPGANYSVSGGAITPTPGFFGDLFVQTRVNDGQANSNIFTLTVSVTQGGASLTITGQNLVNTDEDTSRIIVPEDLIVHDPLGNWPIGFAITVHAGADYTRINSNTILPNPNFNGPLTVPVTVGNGAVASNTFDLIVEVTPINDPPVINSQQIANTPEDTPRPIALNDLLVTDVDNAYPNGFSINVQDGNNYTRLGSVITPSPNFNGVLVIPVSVNDGQANSNTFNFTMTVTPVNDPPVISGQQGTLITDENTPLPIPMSVLSVIDPDNSYPGDFTMNLLPGANYSVSGATVTPDQGFTGSLFVQVRVNDGQNDSNIFVLTIQVTQGGSGPSITSQFPIEIQEDHQREILITDLIVSYPSGSSPSDFTVTVLDGANYTRVNNNTILPNQNYSGSLNVPVFIGDGSQVSNTFALNVLVTPQNDPPIITSQNAASTQEDTPRAVTLGDFQVTDPDDVYPNGFSLNVQDGPDYTRVGTIITPEPNFNGVLNVPVSVNDGSDSSNVFIFNITVNPVNDAPVILGQTQALETGEETPLAILPGHLDVEDPDNTYPSDFTLHLQSGPNYSFTGNTITPLPGFTGILLVQVRVNDGAAYSSIFVLTVSVTSGGTVLAITGQNPVSTLEDEARTITTSDLIVNDPTGLYPAGFTITAGDGEHYIRTTPDTILPDLNYSGPLSVPVTLTDGTQTSESFTLNVIVTPVNDRPIITSQNAVNTQEDNPRLMTLNDLNVQDPDNVYPADFSLRVLDDLTEPYYTHTGNSVLPPPNHTGPLLVDLVVNDGSADSPTFQLNMTVLPVGDAPLITGQNTIQTTEDTPYPLSLDDLVIVDPDNDLTDLTLTLFPGPNYTLDGNTIIPALNYTGSLQAPLRVSDGVLESNLFTVGISVAPVNDAPVISGQNGVTVVEEASRTITLQDLLITDPDNHFPDDFTLSVNPGPNYILDGLTITPDDNFNGELIAPVRVSDGLANSNIYPLRIVVTPVNDPPHISGQFTINTPEETPRTITLQDLIVVDPDNPYPTGFTLAVSDGPDYTRSGSTITPNRDFVGDLTVGVTVNDGLSVSNSFTLQVSVIAVNDPPVIQGQQPLIVSEDSTLDLDFDDLIVQDPDDTYPLGFSLTILDGPNYIHSINTISPSENYHGILTVPVLVSDGRDVSAVFPLTVTISSVNDVPVIVGQSELNTLEDTDIVVSLSNLIVQDPDSSFPSNFTLALEQGSNYSVTGNIVSPDPNYNGHLIVNATVSDGIDSSTPYPLLINVTDVSDAPLINSQNEVVMIEDESRAITFGDLNVTDPDNDYPTGFTMLVFEGQNYDLNGSIISPHPNYNGFLIVPVAVNDGEKTSNQFLLTVTVQEANDVPIILSQSILTTREDVSLPISLANLTISDPDASLGSITLEIAPGANYTVDGPVIIPSPNFFGLLQAPIRLREGSDLSPYFTLNITVEEVNDPPEIVGQSGPLFVQSGNSLTLTLEDVVVVDPDNSFPSHFTLAVRNGAHYTRVNNRITPVSGAAGVLQVPVTVHDGRVTSNTFNLSVQISDEDNGGSGSGGQPNTAPAPPSAGDLVFGHSSYRVDENLGSLTLSILRKGDGEGQAIGVIRTLDGSAIAGQDYEVVEVPVQFEHNEMGEKTFSIPILEDAEPETSEFFQVVVDLQDAPNPNLKSRANISIIDNESASPDTSIVSPQNGSVFNLGEVIALQPQGTDPQGDPIEFFWEICGPDGCETYKGTDSSVQPARPGIYHITCYAADPQGHEDATHAVSTIRVLDDRSQGVKVTHPQEDSLDLVVGEDMQFQAQGADSESDLAWFFTQEPNALFPGASMTHRFTEPGTHTLAVRDLQNPDLVSDWVVVNAYLPGQRPPRLFIETPSADARHYVDAPLALSGGLEDPDQNGSNLSFSWDLGDGRIVQGRNLEGVVYAEPGHYRIGFMAQDGDQQIQTYMNLDVMDENAAPEADFSFAHDLVVPPLYKIWFSAQVLDDRGYDHILYYWDFGDGRSSRQETPGFLSYAKTGVYEVSLCALTPQGVQGRQVKRRIIVSENASPSLPAGKTAELLPGNYENLILDGAQPAHFYSITVAEKDRSLILNLDASAGLEIDILNPAGQPMNYRKIEKKGNVQLHHLWPGPWTIRIAASQGTAAYNLQVQLLKPALFFPEIPVNQDYEAVLSLVNPGDAPNGFKAWAYGADGDLLAVRHWRLNPKARLTLSLNSWFGEVAADTAWLRVDSESRLVGLALVSDRNGERQYAISPSTGTSDLLYAAHVAEDTAVWETTGSIVNGSVLQGDGLVEAQGASASLQLERRFSRDHFNFLDLFNQEIPKGAGWARIFDSDRLPTLVGAEVFGRLNGSMAAGLELIQPHLQDALAVRNDQNLYFPHITRDRQQFWTGVVLLNPTSIKQTLILKAYGRDGGLIGAKALRLDGNQKYAATSVAILEGMRTPEKVDWLSVEAPETIIGFELFGTNSGSSLAGLEAMADLKTELAFPYYDASGRSFHGITVINPHDYSTEIVFTLYDNAGGVLAVSPPQTLAPFMKLATLIADIFPNLPADARPGWMACRADAAITGFQLLISRDGRRMSAAAAH